jgi:dihydroorotate dehydrogenase (fumarate)
MSYSTTIAWIEFENVIFNSSGPRCTTWDELKALQDSTSSGIMMKSCTLEPREGNPEPRYIEVELGSINSMWLPNLGFEKYIEFSYELKKLSNKPVIASIAGLCKDDFFVMVEAFQTRSAVDMIEVNLSCPNVVGKPQIAYDFEASDMILKKIFEIGWEKPIGLKLPPYFDLIHSEMMARVIEKYPVAFVTCINSVGNTLIIDPETESPLIKPKGWFGWLGGDFVKPVALANVRSFYKHIGHKTQIIGCGGIKNGVDVFEHLLAWASAVQLGTVLWKEGVDCFARIEKEFNEYMEKKWYTNIDQVRWKLKEL